MSEFGRARTHATIHCPKHVHIRTKLWPCIRETKSICFGWRKMFMCKVGISKWAKIVNQIRAQQTRILDCCPPLHRAIDRCCCCPFCFWFERSRLVFWPVERRLPRIYVLCGQTQFRICCNDFVCICGINFPPQNVATFGHMILLFICNLQHFVNCCQFIRWAGTISKIRSVNSIRLARGRWEHQLHSVFTPNEWYSLNNLDRIQKTNRIFTSSTTWIDILGIKLFWVFVNIESE